MKTNNQEANKIIHKFQNKLKNHPSITTRDIEILLAHAANYDTKQYPSGINKTITERDLNKFLKYIERRQLGEPTYYITGKAPFWEDEFKVKQGVLIPRKETEFLVEAIINDYKNQTTKTKALELGSGSGNISISIGKACPMFEISSFDISNLAIEIAKDNQRNLNVNNISFIHLDNVPNLPLKSFDVFFSNPPYIAKKDIDTLQVEIKNFEPIEALDGGEDGLDFYRIIARDYTKYLKTNSSLYLEIGSKQKEEIIKLYEKEKLSFKRCIKDYAGFDRILIFKKQLT